VLTVDDEEIGCSKELGTRPTPGAATLMRLGGNPLGDRLKKTRHRNGIRNRD